MKDNKRLQTKVGILLFSFSSLVSLFNLFIILNARGAVDYSTPIITFVSGIIILILSQIHNKVFQYFQGFLSILTGLFYVYEDNQSFFGYWLLIMGLVLLYRYFFFKKFVALKLSIIFVISFSIIVLSTINKHEPLFRSLNFTLFLVTSFIMLYFLFEEDLMKLIKVNRDHVEELRNLKPITIIGERMASIVHSFKNNLSQLNMSLYLIETKTDPEKGIKKLHSLSDELNRRIESLLTISRASYTQEKNLINLTKFLIGVKDTFLEERVFFKNSKITMNLENEVFVKSVELDLLMLLENILKNAIEAIVEKGIYGEIIIDLTRNSLSISGNGGEMPVCKDCPLKEACNSCSKFTKIGFTTKTHGSGNGVHQIIKTCNENEWKVKFIANDGWTRVTIFFNNNGDEESEIQENTAN